jgi:hypothetical protein
MIRVQSLFFAAMLMTSATAFAADTPVPNATGEAAVPSGSNAGGPPAENATDATKKNDSNANATATSPGEENKGKPKIAPQ